MPQCPPINSLSAPASLPTSPATDNLHVYPPAISQVNSTDGSPTTSNHSSPAVNLTWEYYLNVQSNSYNEMWSRIHVIDPNSNHHDLNQNQVEVQVADMNGNEDPYQLLLSQVLQPNRECVEQALRHARPNALTCLVSTYFDHSENTTNLCLMLHQSIHRARLLYAPINELLDIFPLDHHSITESQCNMAYEVFVQFDCVDNPFPCPDSHFQEMRRSFSDLKQKLDRNLRKSQSRVRILRRATTHSTLCIIGTAVAVTLAAVAAVTAHALIAIVVGPFCTACFPCGLTKKELALVAQLDAAKKGTYVLNNDLDTIDRLVARLYTAIEGDKLLVRFVLERERDKHSILEVVKQLRRNQLNFTNQLKDLEEHVCLCFNTVNRSRSLLLKEINLHQTRSSNKDSQDPNP